MYFLFKLYIKYLNLIRGIEAIRIFTEAISLNVLYPLQMDILKFVVKVHLNMAVLRQHPVPNAGPNPNNTGLLSESYSFWLGFLSSQEHLLYCLLRPFCSVGPNGSYFQVRISSTNRPFILL